jgi:hypothetical protein
MAHGWYLFHVLSRTPGALMRCTLCASVRWMTSSQRSMQRLTSHFPSHTSTVQTALPLMDRPVAGQWRVTYATESSSAESTDVAIKKLLRDLYLHVHPDRFALYPAERKVNAASFQNLQSFLRDCNEKERDGIPFPPRGAHSDKSFAITFYFLPKMETSSELDKMMVSESTDEVVPATEEEALSALLNKPTAPSLSSSPSPSPPSLSSVSLNLSLRQGERRRKVLTSSLHRLFMQCQEHLPDQVKERWKHSLSTLLTTHGEASHRIDEEGMEDFGHYRHPYRLSSFARMCAADLRLRTEDIKSSD